MLHLLFPLFSSIVFVIGMMVVKQAITRGATPWTATLFGNVWIFLFWLGVAAYRGAVAEPDVWWQAAIVGVLFFLGQVFTYLAFQFGDVSVAAPVMGVKVLLVATLVAGVTGMTVPARVWLGAALATFGIALVQMTGRSRKPPDGNALPEAQPVGPPETSTTKTGRSIVLAVIAALSLSVFDVLLQTWGRGQDPLSFLPVVFFFAALSSCVLLPWTNSPKELRRLKIVPGMFGGTFLMALQAMSMSFVLSRFGDAARVNIVYAMRGLWGVLLAWSLARVFHSGESTASRSTMLNRLSGAFLLTTAVVIALWR